jgi:predicted deacylase
VVAEADFTLDGRSVSGGSRARFELPVTTGLNGAELALTVHVVHGTTPGPVLVLLSTLHGGEWFSIAPLRRLVSELEPSRLTGTVVVIPVANPPALARQTRDIPDETDSPDLNRIFPGRHTWTSDQIVARISADVLAHASCLLDFHMGPWGSTFRDILIGDDFAPDVAAESERLALAFGSPIIRRASVVSGFPGPRSSIGYAGGVLGIPAMGVEVGGAGFGERLERTWEDLTVSGIRGVMTALGMLDEDPPPLPRRQLVYQTSHRVNPRTGGILRSRFAGDALATEVKADTLLGEIQSPYTGKVMEELRAPADGLLFYTARDYPIHPGGWAFGIAATDHSSRWVEN